MIEPYRIAIFQYEWPLQSHTINLANALLQKGYRVDLLVKGCSKNYVKIDKLIRNSNFRLFDVTFPFEVKRNSRYSLLKKKIWKFCEKIGQKFFFKPVLQSSIDLSINYISKNPYLLLIGIEKKGLIWAGSVAKKLGLPFVYYSLELYDEKHPYFYNCPNFARIRKAEKFYHRNSIATIIQDYDRGIYLLKANGLPVSTTEFWYLPVSVPGPKYQNRTNYLRDKFKIPQKIPIILYFGLIDEPRDCLLLSYLAKTYAGQIKVIAHGFGKAEFLKKLTDESNHELILSLDMVPEEQIPELISSADLGIVLYRRDCANDILTANSSEKVALFCKVGLPFIAFQSDSYVALRNKFRCCELFNSPHSEKIYESIMIILKESECYREEAFKAFGHNYCLENHIERLLNNINNKFPIS